MIYKNPDTARRQAILLLASAKVPEHHADPEDACARLMDLALSRGGPDNVTAVVARYQVDENP